MGKMELQVLALNLEALRVPTVLGEKLREHGWKSGPLAESRRKFTEGELYISLAQQSWGKIAGSRGLGFSCRGCINP